jgi:hypothetical protein
MRELLPEDPHTSSNAEAVRWAPQPRAVRPSEFGVGSPGAEQLAAAAGVGHCPLSLFSASDGFACPLRTSLFVSPLFAYPQIMFNLLKIKTLPQCQCPAAGFVQGIVRAAVSNTGGVRDRVIGSESLRVPGSELQVVIIPFCTTSWARAGGL